MMPMMNNPVFQLMNLMRSGGNPQAILNSMAQSNPMIANVMQLTNGKSPDQLKTLAQNMAKERGVNIDDIVKQLGLNMPK